MAPRSALGNISFTVDSASEDDELNNALPTPDSNAENKAPTRKPRGKAAQTAKAAPATKPVAKGRTSARRVSGGSATGAKKQTTAVAKKAGAKGGRKALAEVQNANASDTEEVDEFAEEMEAAPAPAVKKRGRPAKAKKAQEESVVEEVVPPKRTRKAAGPAPAPAKKAAPKAKAPAKKEKATKRAPSPEPEQEQETIPETQPEPEPMDVDDVDESIEIEEIPETMPPPARPSARRPQPRDPRQTSTGPRRAGSVSDTERDPVLRRKIGDITKKLESITTKYENLKEVATSSRESNFDQLKRQTDQTIKNQDAVIKALKQQISETQGRASEITALKKDVSRLAKENDTLTTENTALKASLTSAQNENKTLQTKLTAARSAGPTASDTKTVPGSAVKARPTGVVLPGTAAAEKEAQIRQLKIDFYSDLTNLVVVGVKKGEDNEDIYDCLQTGRNGSMYPPSPPNTPKTTGSKLTLFSIALHFQLTISTTDENYEDATVFYSPQLDEKRDAELLDLLPDYLTDEIEFPRHQVAKFYEKILDSMTRKIELED